MDKLAANPLKFILFIDDLSFTANDDNFAALKAILEGSVGGRAQNIAVYATSNRRHLIKETLSDRTGDDIHEADTRQELMSLSARFGPDRDLPAARKRPASRPSLPNWPNSITSRCRWTSSSSRRRPSPSAPAAAAPAWPSSSSNSARAACRNKKGRVCLTNISKAHIISLRKMNADMVLHEGVQEAPVCSTEGLLVAGG